MYYIYYISCVFIIREILIIFGRLFDSRDPFSIRFKHERSSTNVSSLRRKEVFLKNR